MSYVSVFILTAPHIGKIRKMTQYKSFIIVYYFEFRTDLTDQLGLGRDMSSNECHSSSANYTITKSVEAILKLLETLERVDCAQTQFFTPNSPFPLMKGTIGCPL